MGQSANQAKPGGCWGGRTALPSLAAGAEVQATAMMQPKRDKHGEGQSLHSWRPPVLPRACKPVVQLSNCDRPRCRLAGASCRCHRSSTAVRQPRGLRLPVPSDDMQITCGRGQAAAMPSLDTANMAREGMNSCTAALALPLSWAGRCGSKLAAHSGAAAAAGRRGRQAI